MIWNEKIECASREEMRNIQSERLRDTVRRIYHNVPYYRKKMQEAGLTPGDIQSIEDIRKLPFTTKFDLRDNYPFGLFTVPMSEIVRLHASSGTTGKPTVVGYTRKDIQMWAECVTRSLCMAGVHRNDIVQIAYGYGLFTGGLGIHYRLV
jgi:phenylacetate-CoA ligase